MFTCAKRGVEWPCRKEAKSNRTGCKSPTTDQNWRIKNERSPIRVFHCTLLRVKNFVIPTMNSLTRA